MSKPISKFEQRVMNVVWELKKCSVRDVFDKLNRQKKLAYTTVATLLQRLYEKGLVSRDEKKSIIIYSPKVSKEAYIKRSAKLLTNDFFKSFGDMGIASFAQSIDLLPKHKKDYFLKLLSKKK
jgi:predicted transcriptional regulator